MRDNSLTIDQKIAAALKPGVASSIIASALREANIALKDVSTKAKAAEQRALDPQLMNGEIQAARGIAAEAHFNAERLTVAVEKLSQHLEAAQTDEKEAEDC